MNTPRRLFIITILLLIVRTVIAGEFALDPSHQADSVFFRSTARLEFIEGKTTAIMGGFVVDPDSVAAGIRGRLRVDLRKLRTGIETRDRHMREKYLHTEQFPYAIFDLQAIKGAPARFEPGKKYRFKATGDFYIHGGYRPVTADIEAEYRNGSKATNLFRVRVRFKMTLDEFGVERPRALFLKLAKTLEIEVNFTAHGDLAFPQIALPSWNALK